MEQQNKAGDCPEEPESDNAKAIRVGVPFAVIFSGILILTFWNQIHDSFTKPMTKIQKVDIKKGPDQKKERP